MLLGGLAARALKGYYEMEKRKARLRNEELRQQQEELTSQNNFIETQRSDLEKAYRNITDSVKYALRIQSAAMPPIAKFHDYFHESFIFFKPRDIVSGDFYWLFRPNEQQKILVVADCTGHGVPGAFMTLISMNLLSQIVEHDHITEPQRILEPLNARLFHYLTRSTTTTGVRDGMDATVVLIDEAEKRMEFASAHQPLWYFSKGKMTEYKGSRLSIGDRLELKHQIQAHSLSYQSKDRFYCFSDGFSDQFGGDEGKKFMSGQFKRLLGNLQTKSLQEQSTALEGTFQQWKGASRQTDDVLVVGIELD